MALKVYVSGMSGNKEVKKRQQRVLMILDSKNIKYEVIDITEPGKENEKEFMQTKSTSNGGTVSDPEPRHALPPQIFNEEEYCGDYDAFDMANEIDTLEQFLKLAPADTTSVSSAQIELKKTPSQEQNGDAKTEEGENKENVEKDASIENDVATAENGGNAEAEKNDQTKDETGTKNEKTNDNAEVEAKEENKSPDNADDVKEDHEKDAEKEVSTEKSKKEDAAQENENKPGKEETEHENKNDTEADEKEEKIKDTEKPVDSSEKENVESKESEEVTSQQNIEDHINSLTLEHTMTSKRQGNAIHDETMQLLHSERNATKQ